jgi:DegV family protein with EDD domain
MNFITGKQLYYAFAAGGEAVIAEREILNRMNVFPVPDGDTGSNLSFTLKSIIENTEIHNDAGETLRSIAQSALIGARGNSGILFAQFVNGMAEAAGDKKKLTLEHFVESVNHAVKRAYEAISNPVEGTMLTVMRDWGDSIKEELQHVKDYPNLFKNTLERAKQSLQDTMHKLEHLRKAGVTDAGARGFVDFITGFHAFLEGGAEVDHLHDRPAISSQLSVDEDPHANLEDLEDLSFRFCTEGIVSGKDIATNGVRESLTALGDSLIVAGGGPHVRIHIHSNEPAEVFYRLKQFGTVSNQKVDDMFRQFQMMKNPKAKIALVIDSTCDLPPEILDEHQIHMAPLTINFGENSFLDRLTLKAEQFYKLLDEESEFPTTSQPSPSIFSRLYGHLSSHYNSVIAVHISRPLSGTYNTSAQEASQIEGTKISVIDSKTISAALGLIVLEAAKAIEAGKSHEEVVEFIETLSDRTDMWVTTPSLNNFIRGGRVSKFKGGIGKLLGMRPIIGVTKDGASCFRDKAFSYQGALKKIVDQVIAGHKEREIHSFCVVHATAQEEAEWVAQQVEESTGVKATFLSEISPVLGAHGGLGVVNIGLLYKK